MKTAFTYSSTPLSKPALSFARLTAKLALITFSLGLSVFAYSAYESTQQTPLYSGPSNKTPLSNEALAAKTNLEILRKTGDFSLVKTDNGELGWIETKFVRFFSTPEELQQKAAEEARNEQEILQSTEQQIQQQIQNNSTANSVSAQPQTQNVNAATQTQLKIAEATTKNPHSSRKLNAVVEVISPDADPNTKAMIMGQNAEQISDSNENITDPQTNEPMTEQQKLLDSIDNALTQQVPNTVNSDATSTVGSSTVTVSAKKDHNANSTYIFDSSPHANRLELLSEENTHLRNELEKAKNYILKNIPTKDTQTIFEESELLQSQLVLLRTENQRLQENNNDSSFFKAIMIFIFGSIIGFLITKILDSRKNRSNW